MVTPEQLNAALHAYLFNGVGYSGDTIVDDQTIPDWIIGVSIEYEGRPALHLWEREAALRWYDAANAFLDNIEQDGDDVDDLGWIRDGEPRRGIAWAMVEVANDIFDITDGEGNSK